MGNDVHIEREEPINLFEWCDYVKRDHEMRLEDFGGIAAWLSYSKPDEPAFGYDGGRIVVRNPDAEIIGKMREVAAYFRACVLGADGERYD